MNKFAFMILSFLAVILFILMIIFDSGDNRAEQKAVMREQAPPSVSESRAVFQKSETFTTSKIPADGLVAYYPFNGNANDASGNGNHGAVHGATLTEDRFGNPNSAYYFDGQSWIVVKDDQTIKPSNALTISAWIKIDDFSNINDYLRIISKHGEVTEAGGSHGSYQLVTGRKKERGTCYFTLRTSTKYNSTTTKSAVSLNKWHLITATWDGSTAKLYFDEEIVAIGNFTGNIKYDNNSLYIGRDGYYPQNLFTGCIDEVRIFNKELNAREVIGLFNSN